MYRGNLPMPPFPLAEIAATRALTNLLRTTVFLGGVITLRPPPPPLPGIVVKEDDVGLVGLRFDPMEGQMAEVV